MQIGELIKVFILGIIQSITEWLPISSTGHMLLFNELLPLNITPEFKEVFFVLIQLGSIMAVVVLYFTKLNPFSSKHKASEKKDIWQLWAKVLIGSLPAGIIGILFDDYIDALFYNNVFIIAAALIIYGIMFILIENRNKAVKPQINSFAELKYSDAIKIGCFQMLALVPGTSRSGSTILGAMLTGVNRYVAAEFSFFLAIPAMFGASLIKLLKFGLIFTPTEIIILGSGMLIAFVGSIVVIKFLLSYIKRNDFKIFGYYRIVLGLLVLVYFLLIK
ncbi:MAG: undecaprenyl-diphosphate phosphatase [Erysipelotrichaceae bacterium]|nr:undecaprenyl-diphosphate phosphatase [Erysipelotrichaceae bacterium]